MYNLREYGCKVYLLNQYCRYRHQFRVISLPCFFGTHGNLNRVPSDNLNKVPSDNILTWSEMLFINQSKLVWINIIHAPCTNSISSCEC